MPSGASITLRQMGHGPAFPVLTVSPVGDMLIPEAFPILAHWPSSTRPFLKSLLNFFSFARGQQSSCNPPSTSMHLRDPQNVVLPSIAPFRNVSFKSKLPLPGSPTPGFLRDSSLIPRVRFFLMLAPGPSFFPPLLLLIF